MSGLGATTIPAHTTIDVSEALLSSHQQEIAKRAVPIQEQAKTFKRCCNYLSGLTAVAGSLLATNLLLAVRETYVSQNPVLSPMLKFGSALLGTGALSGAAALYCYQRNKKCQHELARLERQINLREDEASPASSLTASAATRRLFSYGRQALQV